MTGILMRYKFIPSSTSSQEAIVILINKILSEKMNFLRGKAVPTHQCDKRKSLVTILCETILSYRKDEISAVS